MNSKFSDWKILASYILVLTCGILIGLDLSSEKFLYINLPSWLSAIATCLAVGVALYTTRLNLDRDRYKIECGLKIKQKSQYQCKTPFEPENIELVLFNECKLRAVNTGLRPIAIECIKIRTDSGTWHEVSTSVRGGNGFPVTAVLEPGNFLEWSIPEDMYIKPDNSIRDISAYVVDALGIMHYADVEILSPQKD